MYLLIAASGLKCLWFKCFKKKHCSIFKHVHAIFIVSLYTKLFVQNLVIYPIILLSFHDIFHTRAN